MVLFIWRIIPLTLCIATPTSLWAFSLHPLSTRTDSATTGSTDFTGSRTKRVQEVCFVVVVFVFCCISNASVKSFSTTYSSVPFSSLLSIFFNNLIFQLKTYIYIIFVSKRDLLRFGGRVCAIHKFCNPLGQPFSPVCCRIVFIFFFNRYFISFSFFYFSVHNVLLFGAAMANINR